MKNPIKLSHGNSKIHKALIWNLPSRKTCPGATDLCKQICYAHDSEVLYRHVAPQSRARNLEIARRKDFKVLMIEKLQRARLQQVRIHESGDFFNQKYLDDWVAIIKSNPRKTFWAYTKSWNLDFTEALKLKNLYLRYSIDASTKHYPEQDLPHASVSEHRNDFFVCPSTSAKGHEIQCMKDCSYCTECREPLTFRPHGNKKSRVAKLETEILLDLQLELTASK